MELDRFSKQKRKPGRKRMQGHAARHNWRNQAKKYEALLRSACVRLEQYGVEMPDRVREWWKVQKSLALIGRVNASEFGVLQTMLADEEARMMKINEEFS
jgi:hypothetical protein